MKRKFKFYAAVLFSFVMLFSFESCNKSQFSNNRNVSSATGWAINNKKGGFQYNTNYKGQQTPPNMVLVEGGTYTKGRVQDDPMRDWNNSPNQQHVQSFYMDQTEVTNVMYLEYLDWLKRNEDYDVYMGALPDTLVWRNKLGYAEEMVNSYLRHPAFSDYPVVGVSWVQAYEYAEWRTDRYQELILENSGWLSKGATLTDKGGKIANNDSLIKSGNFNQDAYVQIPNKSFGGEDNIEGWSELLKGNSSRKESNRIANIRGVSADSMAPSSANRETGLITPKFRLPTESEWEYAALGLKEVREFNVYQARKKYPWQGQYTRTGQRKNLGDQLANFKNSDGDYGGIAGWSDDGADITNRVGSYNANAFGLYDMAGNVAEWVADVFRPIFDDEFNFLSPPTPKIKLMPSKVISGMFFAVLSPPFVNKISSFGNLCFMIFNPLIHDPCLSSSKPITSFTKFKFSIINLRSSKFKNCLPFFFRNQASLFNNTNNSSPKDFAS